MTHYLLPNGGRWRWGYAACGLCSRFLLLEHSAMPTCPACQDYLRLSR